MLVRGEAGEGFEPLGEVVGVEESRQVRPELGVALVIISSHGRFLDGAVPAFDLPAGPGVVGLGEAMINVVEGTGIFKGMSPEEFAAL